MPKLTSPQSVEYLALEGGGGKGIAYLGAIRALEQLGVLPIDVSRPGAAQIKGISGSSAGAITALLLAMGVGSDQFGELLLDAAAFRRFYDGPDIGRHRYVNAQNQSTVHAEPATQGRPPVTLIQDRLDALQEPLGQLLVVLAASAMRLGGDGDIARKLKARPVEYVYNFLFDRGLFPGFAALRYLQQTIGRFLERQMFAAGGGRLGGDQITGNTLNFETFHRLTGVDLVVTGVNITTKRPGVFSKRHTPKFPVADAVSISMSFPVAFKPVLVDAEVEVGPLHNDRKAYCGRWVDGGLLTNLPLHAFDHLRGGDRRSPDALHPAVLGLRLMDGPATGHDAGRPPGAFAGLASSLKGRYLGVLFEHLGDVLESALWPSEEGQLRTTDERQQTIELPTFDLETLEFAPPPAKYEEPVRVARERTLAYFSS